MSLRALILSMLLCGSAIGRAEARGERQFLPLPEHPAQSPAWAARAPAILSAAGMPRPLSERESLIAFTQVIAQQQGFDKLMLNVNDAAAASVLQVSMALHAAYLAKMDRRDLPILDRRLLLDEMAQMQDNGADRLLGDDARKRFAARLFDGERELARSDNAFAANLPSAPLPEYWNATLPAPRRGARDHFSLTECILNGAKSVRIPAIDIPVFVNGWARRLVEIKDPIIELTVVAELERFMRLPPHRNEVRIALGLLEAIMAQSRSGVALDLVLDSMSSYIWFWRSAISPQTRDLALSVAYWSVISMDLTMLDWQRYFVYAIRLAWRNRIPFVEGMPRRMLRLRARGMRRFYELNNALTEPAKRS